MTAAADTTSRVRALIGTFALPTDYVAWAALGVGILLLIGAALGGAPVSTWLEGPRAGGPARTRFLMTASFAAAFLSLGYVAHYLGGGPRIIDATSYFLEGRTLAQGGFTFPILDPTASFRGRFLLFSEPNQLGVIFPPGYPAILAFGFVIGAPMVIGPLIAAALTIATYVLAHEIAREALGEGRALDVERAARAAALFSVVSAALRYHTADTMAHGAAATTLAFGLAALLRARRTGSRHSFALLGLAVGALISIRPISALPLTALAALGGASGKRLGRVATFAAPGVLLLVASQAAVAHSWLASTQKAYYAASDGPPGCFRYGFGAGIGCLFEHGDFVASRLEHGFGLLPALGTTLRRLRLHLLDGLNFELLFLALAALSAKLVRRASSAKLAALVILGQVLVYAPFYFDGSYPGGGARFYADVIPVEHALFAVAFVDRWPSRAVTVARAVAITMAVAALGFALHASHDHVALMKRDGGRPMFEPDLVRESHKDHGLIFFDSDHGFNLALQPGVTPSHGIVAVRLRNDDRDRYLYDVLGRPSTHRYVFGPEKSTLEPWTPPGSGVGAHRFESEGEWPPIAQRGGWAIPVWATGTASNDRYLKLTPDSRSQPGSAKEGASAELELLVPLEGRYTLEGSAVLEGGGATGSLEVIVRGKVAATWTWDDPALAAPKPKLFELKAQALDLAAPARLRLVAVKGPVGLDRVILRTAK